MTFAEPAWSRVTAVFGGTFDPPHLGHRQAVEGLFVHPGVSRVLVIPSPIPPHKQTGATAGQRLEMTRLTFDGLSKTGREVAVDSRELKRAERNPKAPTYTYDTLMELKAEHTDPAFVIGADQFLELHTWHRFPEVLKLAHWIVLERKSQTTDTMTKRLQELRASALIGPESSRLWRIEKSPHCLIAVPTPAPGISSTQIREQIARSGTPPEGALLPSVAEYLKLHRIYGTSTAS